MNWLLLIAAGLVEVIWSQSIKPTRGFTRPIPTIVCFLLAAAAVYLLAKAMETLPVGTAYTVFTGIGAIGAVTLGIVLQKDPVTPGRLAAIGTIVAGVILARLTNPE